MSALDTRAGESGGAEVLDADHGVALSCLQARLYQHLFEERVPDLHGGPQLPVVVESLGGESGRAVDAVATGVGPDQHHQIARAARVRRPKLLVPEQPDAHGVDQRIAGVAGREVHLPSHVRDSDAVSVS